MMEKYIIVCIECGKNFEFSLSEQNRYREYGYAPPKRCKTCRALNKERNSKEALPKIGYKTSTYFENISVYGPRVNVAGGLSVEHTYLIRFVAGDETKYLKGYEGNVELTTSTSEAIQFNWSEDLDELKSKLSQSYNTYKIDLYPLPKWMSLEHD